MTTLRSALLGDRPLIGTFLMIPRTEIVEMLGLAGFDAIIIDLEHGPMGASDLPGVVSAAQGAGLFAIARVPTSSENAIGNALDSGVDGVLVPHVHSAEEAERIVRAARFPPAGDRSLNPYVRGTHYGKDESTLRQEANDRVAIMVMIEGKEGLENSGRICQVSDIDAAFIGPVDLSASLGVPGQPEHPRVVETVENLLRGIARSGVAGAIYAPTPEAALRWLEVGASFVALSADSAMTRRAFAAARAEVGDVIIETPSRRGNAVKARP